MRRGDGCEPNEVRNSLENAAGKQIWNVLLRNTKPDTRPEAPEARNQALHRYPSLSVFF